MSPPLNRVIQGNCLTIMREWPEESVDFVMTSPPYWGLRNYGEATETVWGGDTNCEHEWSTNDEIVRLNKKKWMSGQRIISEKELHYFRRRGDKFCLKCGAWRGQLGLEPTWQMYVEHLVLTCREVKRVLKQTGSMYLVLGDTFFGKPKSNYEPSGLQSKNYGLRNSELGYAGRGEIYKQALKNSVYQSKCLMGMPWRVAFALIEDGWILRERIVWHKDNPMPGSQRDRLTQTCEVIFHFVRNTGKALLWRNELTGEWLEKRPKQVYFHVETKKLREDRPSKKEKYVVDPSGNRYLIWKPLWRGFNYYYELDAIRIPWTDERKADIQRALNKHPGYKGKYGKGYNIEYRRFLPGQGIKGQPVGDPRKGKNPGDIFQTRRKPYIGNNPHRMRLEKQKFLALDTSRPTDLSHPSGKNPGDVVLTKHDIAVRRFPTVNREGGLGYTDPLHVKAYHEKGKNPGDVVQVQPEGHGHDRLGSRGPGLRPWNERFHPKGKNPGDIIEDFSAVLNMVMQTYSNVADVEVEEWQGKSHSKNRQHGLRRLALNERKARIRFEIALDKLEIHGSLRKKLIAYWHNHSTHPKGKNPGDVLKLDTVACPSGPQRWEREGKNRVEARFHPDGKNPGDYWSIPTRPFKGAHFAVYPEAICVRPIKSSCPMDGVVLDPMCGSGTTCVVAKKMGRKYIGVEINPEYVELAKKRLSAIPLKLDDFIQV